MNGPFPTLNHFCFGCSPWWAFYQTCVAARTDRDGSFPLLTKSCCVNRSWWLIPSTRSLLLRVHTLMDYFPREGFIRENNLDKLRQAVTIAGACTTAYRTSHLPKDTISIIQAGGYRLADPQSREDICWLMWVAHNRGIDSHHAGIRRSVAEKPTGTTEPVTSTHYVGTIVPGFTTVQYVSRVLMRVTLRHQGTNG